MLTVSTSITELDAIVSGIATTLQISPTQHRVAEEHYTAIGSWLEAPGSPLQAAQPSIYVQGSLQLGTTVKPLRWTEYDVDLVCEFHGVDWRSISEPAALLDAVEARLAQHQHYAKMIEKKNRCIRLNYAGEFHLDVLPACSDPISGTGHLLVPDRDARSWRPSNPRGYVAWFDSRTKLFQGRLLERMAPPPAWEPMDLKPPLKIAVQLLKRWRDIAYRQDMTKSPASILLTTLAGQLYQGEQSISVAVGLILDGSVEAIERCTPRLVVPNPTNVREDLSERWDNASDYSLFCSRIRDVHGTWKKLQGERGLPAVSAVLGQLFGEDLTKRVLSEYGDGINKERSHGNLGVRKGSAALGAFSAGSSIAVPRNSFYGS